MNNASLTEEIKLVSWFNHTDRLLLLAQKSANVNTSAQFCGHHLLLGVELGLGFSHWSTIKLVTSVFCYDQEIIERMATRASICYRPQRSWGKVIFSQASVILSTGGGACVVAGGACVVSRGACMIARRHVWLLGGVWLPGGVCMVAGGHVWLLGGMRCCRGWGACMVARGCAWLWGGVHGIWRDTFNEWAVRILLECILVHECVFYQLIMIRVKAEGRF